MLMYPGHHGMVHLACSPVHLEMVHLRGPPEPAGEKLGSWTLPERTLGSWTLPERTNIVCYQVWLDFSQGVSPE